MNKNFHVTLLNKLAKEQRKWLVYALKIKKHYGNASVLIPIKVKTKNPEEGC
jgi:hypothetical protein